MIKQEDIMVMFRALIPQANQAINQANQVNQAINQADSQVDNQANQVTNQAELDDLEKRILAVITVMQLLRI